MTKRIINQPIVPSVLARPDRIHQTGEAPGVSLGSC
jgi:hypothetical protein